MIITHSIENRNINSKEDLYIYHTLIFSPTYMGIKINTGYDKYTYHKNINSTEDQLELIVPHIISSINSLILILTKYMGE